MCEKIIPQLSDIERSVLAAMILENDTIPLVVNAGEGLLYKPQHQLILNAIDALNVEGIEVDQLTLAEKLKHDGNLDKVGGEITLAAIISETISAGNINYHIELLKQKQLLRSLLSLGISIANNCYGNGTDPAEILHNIESQLSEIKEAMTKRKQNLTEQIREWVSVTDGDFYVTQVDKELEIVTKRDKSSRRKIFQRLVEQGIIEKASVKQGHYRLVDVDCELIDWSNAESETVDIKFPFGIEDYVEIMPGNLIVIAGVANSGKTAFLLDFIRLNMNTHELHYFNSEMGKSELRKRIVKFDMLRPED